MAKPMKLKKGTPVVILIPRADVPDVKAGREGVVLAHRLVDNEVLVKLAGRSWPVSYPLTSLA
jgi:hypothetical protein